MLLSRPIYLSEKVGYLSELTSYLRFGKVTGWFYPWMDNPPEPCLYEFVLENDDNLVLENDDKFLVNNPC